MKIFNILPLLSVLGLASAVTPSHIEVAFFSDNKCSNATVPPTLKIANATGGFDDTQRSSCFPCLNLVKGSTRAGFNSFKITNAPNKQKEFDFEFQYLSTFESVTCYSGAITGTAYVPESFGKCISVKDKAFEPVKSYGIRLEVSTP